MRISRRSRRDEVWRSIAAAEGGEVIEGRRGPKKVVVPHRAWNIVLDQYTQSNGQTSSTYTRVRALYEPNLDFRFALYRENVFGRIAKFFGMKDVTTGDLLLDRDYIVRTDNESMIRSLVAGSRIGQLLVAQPSGRFQTAKFRGRRKPRPDRAAELRWQAGSVITDAERLRGVVRLFRETLDRMERIGATREVPVAYDL